MISTLPGAPGAEGGPAPFSRESTQRSLKREAMMHAQGWGAGPTQGTVLVLLETRWGHAWAPQARSCSRVRFRVGDGGPLLCCCGVGCRRRFAGPAGAGGAAGWRSGRATTDGPPFPRGGSSSPPFLPASLCVEVQVEVECRLGLAVLPCRPRGPVTADSAPPSVTARAAPGGPYMQLHRRSTSSVESLSLLSPPVIYR